MKKTITLLIALIIFIGFNVETYAKTYTDKFYIGDTIDGIYYAKVKNNKTEYRKAKYKRSVTDNKIVYCIEPFVDLKENTSYIGYDQNYEKLLNLSTKKWERVRLLAYYGYGYNNHTDGKWYAITQIMIWKTIDENAEFYWTDTFKGKKISQFTEEEKELENLIKNHYIKPSFSNMNLDTTINSDLIINDQNQVLSNYKITNTDYENIKIENNNLIISTGNEERIINIELEKKDDKYQSVPVIYVSNTYQNVLSVGAYESIKINLKVTINSGSVKIIKQDKDTNSIETQGEASLIGTTYELLDLNRNPVYEIVIGEDSSGIVKNVKYGQYIVREKISGNGYKLDFNEYIINVNNENKEIELVLQNEVIKSKVKLYKYYEKEENKKELEENITFHIINNKGEIYKEVTTDKNGYAEFELPFGTYIIKQVNTTDGYYKVDDFLITIDEDTEEIIEYHLNDLKIPNTYQETNHNIIAFLIIITSLLVLLKKHEKQNI